MTAHTEALARLVEQGYDLETAQLIVGRVTDVTAPPCLTCGGSGWVPHPTLPYTRNEPCRDCDGTGTPGDQP